MLERLTHVCRQTMRGTISVDDDLVGRGLNANRALTFIRRVWLQTGVELDVNVFYGHRTLRAIAHAIENDRLDQGGKIVTLRTGNAAEPLFLFAGGVNCFLETQDLVDSLGFTGAIYGITLTDFQRPWDRPPVVADEVDLAFKAMTEIQPQGPYRLAGYSFGGILALELARRVRAEGHEVACLTLIDPPQNDHVWPFRSWAGLMRRVLVRQFRSVANRTFRKSAPRPAENPSDRMMREIERRAFAHSPKRRGHPLLFRFRDPRHPDYPLFAAQWAGGYVPAYDARARQLLQMKGLYRPSVFDGAVTFIASMSGSPIDCDAPTIWKPFLPQAEWISVPGNHLSMIVARNAREVAACMDARLKDASAVTEGLAADHPARRQQTN